MTLDPASTRVLDATRAEIEAQAVGEMICMVGAEQELRRNMRAIRARRSGLTEGVVLGFLYGFIAGGSVFVACLRLGWLQ